MEKECEDCKYYEESENFRDYEIGKGYENYAIGWCHRYPPYIKVEDIEHLTQPETPSDGWCGEFSLPCNDKPVSDLGLSVRAKRGLFRLGITLVSQIENTPDVEFLKIKNIGESTVIEIRKAVDYFRSNK
jgi:hypothetical protein